MYNAQPKSELELQFGYEILSEFGFDINPDGFLIDEEDEFIIQINGKLCNINPDNAYDIDFNPLRNTVLTNRLFSQFASRYQELNGIYIKAFYPIYFSSNRKINNLKKYELNYTVGNQTSTISTSHYANDSICLLELACMLNNTLDNERRKSFMRFDDRRITQ